MMNEQVNVWLESGQSTSQYSNGNHIRIGICNINRRCMQSIQSGVANLFETDSYFLGTD